MISFLTPYRKLAQLLHRVPRHSRRTDRLLPLRLKGLASNEAQICRFKLPKELVDQAKREINQKGDIQLFPACNDRLIILYNPVLATGRRANTDFSHYTDPHAVT